jgi:hypothetical protein
MVNSSSLQRPSDSMKRIGCKLDLAAVGPLIVAHKLAGHGFEPAALTYTSRFFK